MAPSKASQALRPCQHEGCEEEGLYPAPRSRERLHDYYWFCLPHVRAYHQNWNYYAGMTPDSIEESRREDVTWQRPSWAFAAASDKVFLRTKMGDPLGILDQDERGRPSDRGQEGQKRRFDTKERQAMALFNLSFPFSLDQLKLRYKTLAKDSHPDLNQGCKKAEENFKKITLA